MQQNYNKFRSQIFSILKIEFGWDGCIPASFDLSELEDEISLSHSLDKCVFSVSQSLADRLHAHGAVWLQRIDGKPNSRLPNHLVKH